MGNYGTQKQRQTLSLQVPARFAFEDGTSLGSFKTSRQLCSLALQIRNTLQGLAQTSAHQMLFYHLVNTSPHYEVP